MKSTGKRILLFLLLTFLLTYAYEIFVVYPVASGTLVVPQAMAQLVVAAAMFIPALCVLIVRLATKEGFADCWAAPHFRAHWKTYLLAWLLPVGLVLLGAALFFLIYPEQFDANMGYLIMAAKASNVEMSVETARIAGYSQLFTGIFIAPLANFIPCFGEEWGWRGYLVPKMMEKLRVLPTMLISGVIWGLWHAPLTIIGHNYGIGYAGYPYLGIAAMCCFCVVMGTLFSYLSFRARSCIPAVIGHAMLNGLAAAGLLFTSGQNIDPFIGPAATGIVGGAGFIVTMIVCLVFMVRKEKMGTLIVALPSKKAEKDLQ